MKTFIHIRIQIQTKTKMRCETESNFCNSLTDAFFKISFLTTTESFLSQSLSHELIHEM